MFFSCAFRVVALVERGMEGLIAGAVVSHDLAYARRDLLSEQVDEVAGIGGEDKG
jgi:hypothetical protein